jgi:hypothetical protein
MKPIATKIDYLNLRNERQHINNNKVINAIKSRNMNDFNDNINKKELVRVIEEINISVDELINKCANDDILCKITSGRISKNASRQGTNDETLQLEMCNMTTSKLGVFVNNLTSTAFRPTKDGKIISKGEMEDNKISKDMCLKSFDAKITGKLNGWIFAKVVMGSGGHQDNVFEEADILCNWVLNYGKNYDELFVVMIDTDNNIKLNIIKNKYINVKNLIIVDHYDFQNFIINKYYDESI